MRKLFISTICLCVLFVTGFAGYRSFHIWKQKHLVTMARQFVAKADGANAVLCLRQALQSNPNNLEACRMMADFAEATRSPQAVTWRSRVVELEPDSLPNRLALARTATGVGNLALAQKALDGVDDDDKETAVYQTMAGAVDLAAKNFSDAEVHFAEAARLQPTNAVSQLHLATLRLQKNDPQAAAEARATLQRLTTDPGVRVDALRQLTLDALQHTNLDAALTFSQDLLKETNSVFGDRMLRLNILGAGGGSRRSEIGGRTSDIGAVGTGATPYDDRNAELEGFLAELQRESANHPAEAYDVARWMLMAGKPAPTLAWMQTLPPATRTNLPLPMTEADCYMALKNWAGLQTNLVGQNWSGLECMRRACLARAYREQGATSSAKAEWISAMKAAGTRRELLTQLYSIVVAWNWGLEQEDVLWAIANRYPSEMPVIQALSERLYAAGNTRSLQTLFSLATQNNRTNLAMMNNLAMTALLLESWEKKPHELAREAYGKASTNASIVSTYAYSLLVQQKTNEALQTIQRLSSRQLEEPTIAAYYGLILKASGQGEKANQYFEIASKEKLLPEERKLIERARRGG
jgi:cytochrome c-type biogenesis protein CcmH/NrfG